MKTKKICLLGRFAVGKTSLVDRFVNNAFSETYQTTVGVSISTKIIDDFKMIIWDIAGFEHDKHYLPYLRGIHGAIWVIDSTEPESVEITKRILENAPQLKTVPSVCFINKIDLIDQQRLTDANNNYLKTQFNIVIRSSAKTGEQVETGFTQIKSLIENVEEP